MHPNSSSIILQNFLQKEKEMRENIVGVGFLVPPQQGLTRVNIIGEISTAVEFLQIPLQISFELWLPPGWVFDREEVEFLSEREREDESFLELNRPGSTTQLSIPLMAYNAENHEEKYIHGFSFPFDWQMIVEDDALIKQAPKLLLQVVSIDSWGRYRNEGYGILEIPKKPGYYQLAAETWKPYESINTKIHDFFLGGTQKILNFSELASTYVKGGDGKNKALNRFLLKTESAGKVQVNLNIAYQSNDFKEKALAEMREIKHQEKVRAKKDANPNPIIGPQVQQLEGGFVSRFTGGFDNQQQI